MRRARGEGRADRVGVMSARTTPLLLASMLGIAAAAGASVVGVPEPVSEPCAGAPIFISRTHKKARRRRQAARDAAKRGTS
jgi:hypothetical protein